MLAAIFAAALDSVRPMTLSGTLDASSNTGTVTSATRTVTVPAGNSGVFTFSGYVDVGAVTSTRYSRNGGAFVIITDGSDTVAFSNGDTIAIETQSVGIGESRALNLIDKTTDTTIEVVNHFYA